MATRVNVEDWVSFPLARVFALFSNPENLPRVMPAATETRLDRLHLIPPPPSPGSNSSRAAGVGSVIETSFRLFPFLPLRARWIARITEFEWNRYFADVQEKGPFWHWHHRHEFAEENRLGINGTLVRDVVDYEIGFGPLGSVANSLFVERQMRLTFKQRQKILPELLSRS